MTHPMPPKTMTIEVSYEQYARLEKRREEKQHGVDEMTPPPRKAREVTLREIIDDLLRGW